MLVTQVFVWKLLWENSSLATKTDDMDYTTMRVTKRTARYVEFLKGLLRVRRGQDYLPDDVIWEALTNTFGDDIKYAGGEPSSDKDAEK